MDKKKRPQKNPPPKITDLNGEQRKLALQKQKHCDAVALHIVHRLIECPVEPDVFLQTLKYLNQAHLDDIVEERNLSELCGYPLCGQTLPAMPKKKYHISTKLNKVYDITERKKYCTNYCYKAAVHVKSQMLTSPLWYRDKEEIPNFELLSTSERGTPGEEVNLGIVQLKPSEQFTSVSKFAIDALEDVPHDVCANVEIKHSPANTTPTRPAQKTDVKPTSSAEKTSDVKPTHHAEKTANVKPARPTETTKPAEPTYYNQFESPSLADILRSNAQYFSGESSNTAEVAPPKSPQGEAAEQKGIMKKPANRHKKKVSFSEVNQTKYIDNNIIGNVIEKKYNATEAKSEVTYKKSINRNAENEVACKKSMDRNENKCNANELYPTVSNTESEVMLDERNVIKSEVTYNQSTDRIVENQLNAPGNKSNVDKTYQSVNGIPIKSEVMDKNITERNVENQNGVHRNKNKCDVIKSEVTCKSIAEHNAENLAFNVLGNRNKCDAVKSEVTYKNATERSADNVNVKKSKKPKKAAANPIPIIKDKVVARQTYSTPSPKPADNPNLNDSDDKKNRLRNSSLYKRTATLKIANSIQLRNDVKLSEQLKTCLNEWITLDTLTHLYGNDLIKTKMPETAYKNYINSKSVTKMEDDKQKKYEAICKRLNLMELADRQFDSSVTGKKLKPLPSFNELKDEADKMDLRVQAFYSGVFEMGDDESDAETEDGDDQETKESPEFTMPAVLPLVDSVDARVIRKKVFLMSLSRTIPKVCEIFRLSPNSVLSDLKKLVDTFDLSAKNIDFKSSEWSIVAILLIKLLSIRENQYDEAFQGERTAVFIHMQAKLNSLTETDTKTLLGAVDVDRFMEICMSKDRQGK